MYSITQRGEHGPNPRAEGGHSATMCLSCELFMHNPSGNCMSLIMSLLFRMRSINVFLRIKRVDARIMTPRM